MAFQADAFQSDAFQSDAAVVVAVAPALLELYDPVAGNRGLRGPARLLFHFEEPDGVMPSDAAANLGDLAPDAGTAAPHSIGSWSGRGRSFGGTEALSANDLAGRDTLLQRDITVQAILSFDVADGDSAYRTLIARGTNDGTASQRRAYRLALQRNGADVDVFWEWQDSLGNTQEQGAGRFQAPAPGKLFLLTATRRWEASNRVVVRYYVDERFLEEHESTHGDIGGGTLGSTTIGGVKSLGSWDEYYNGVIDELAVYDFEMSPAEVRAVWLRLYEHQPGGVDTLAGLIPTGAPWMKDPSNKIGRRMKVVGQGLGSAAAIADELREMWLPDLAPSAQLARWESLHGVKSRPRDSLDTRRARLLGVTGREEGFSHPAIKAALLELLDLDDVADIEIIEGQNVIADKLGEIADERWLRGDTGTWSIVSGTARITVPIATDVSWETAGWGAHMRTSLDTGGVGPQFMQVSLVARSLPVDSGAGLLLADRRTNTGLWFGVYNDGAEKIGYRKVTDGIPGAFVSLVTASAGTYHLRIGKPDGSGFFLGSAGTFTMKWSNSGTEPEDFDDADVVTGMLDPDWGGLALWGTSTSLAAQATADFDEFTAFCPFGARPHHWYVFRDPLLPGVADIVGANALLQRLKPAHTHAAVIQSRSVLANDDRDGRAGRGPMGVLHSPP